MIRLSGSLPVIVLLFLTSVVSGQEAAPKGSLSLSGAWAIYPTVVAWGEAFHKKYPGVVVNVSAGGAGKGAAEALAGMVDIGMVSRDPDSAEIAKGIFPIYILHDAVFAVVSQRNPELSLLMKKGLKKEDWIDLYVTGRKTAWNQFAGGTSDKSVHVYTRSDACGASSSWAKYLNKKQEDLRGVGVYGDPGILEAVKRDPLGIGYSNFSYVFGRDGSVLQGICLVPIDANGNGIADSAEIISGRAAAITAIESGTYPVTRKNYFFVKGKPAGLAAEFIKFSLSDAGTKIVEDVGASLPLAPQDRAKSLQWNERMK